MKNPINLLVGFFIFTDTIKLIKINFSDTKFKESIAKTCKQTVILIYF